MAEPSTIARPYAEAVFRLADRQGKLAEWSAALANLSAIASDERVRAAIADPNLATAKIAGLFLAVLRGELPASTEVLVTHYGSEVEGRALAGVRLASDLETYRY